MPIPTCDTVLIRLVRMTFHPDRLDAFLSLFDEVAPHIRAFPGCLHLELWQDARYPGVVQTYSHWRDAAALKAYRESTLFEATWARTRTLFAAPPRAWSMVRIRDIPFSEDVV